MIALIQRVSEAAVRVDGEVVGEIDQGLLVLLGVEKDDDEAKAKRLMERVTTYRVFEDDEGKMNLNVKQVNGKVLVVSQFTLPADTKKGTRAGFSRGAHPAVGAGIITACPTGRVFMPFFLPVHARGSVLTFENFPRMP